MRSPGSSVRHPLWTASGDRIGCPPGAFDPCLAVVKVWPPSRRRRCARPIRRPSGGLWTRPCNDAPATYLTLRAIRMSPCGATRSAMVRLGEVEPRERAGARTAQRYEFQYQRTARATLTLLDDASDHVCVYCDWHDDYVIEVDAQPTRYVFHQVKGRSSSRPPWTFSEFFG